MKKLLLTVLCLLTCCCFIGCNDATKGNEGANNSPSTTESTEKGDTPNEDSSSQTTEKPEEGDTPTTGDSSEKDDSNGSLSDQGWTEVRK